jgi:hypothetical protein
MTEKWSVSAHEGRILKRITNAIDKKTKQKDLDNLPIEQLMEMGKKIAYISMQKSNLAKNSDWEERLNEIAASQKTIKDKMALMELKDRQGHLATEIDTSKGK